MKGKTTLSRGSIGTDFGHRNGYQALDLKGFFSLLLKCSLKTLRSQYVPQIRKKQPGNKWPLKAPCVGCLIVPGARGAAAVLAMSMATLSHNAAYTPSALQLCAKVARASVPGVLQPVCDKTHSEIVTLHGDRRCGLELASV